MAYIDSAACVLAPSVNSNYQTLSGTGTAEAVSKPLHTRRYATLKVGATPVRVQFRGEESLTDQVATTDLYLAAGERFDWLVSQSTCFVYVEAADGASPYEAWVWESSSST